MFKLFKILSFIFRVIFHYFTNKETITQVKVIVGLGQELANLTKNKKDDEALKRIAAFLERYSATMDKDEKLALAEVVTNTKIGPLKMQS